MSASPSSCPAPPPGRRPPRSGGGCRLLPVLASVLAGVGLLACGYPAPSAASSLVRSAVHALPAAPPDPALLGGGDGGCRGAGDLSGFPPIDTAPRPSWVPPLAFSPTPVALAPSGLTSDGFNLEITQVITDFPVPPDAAPGPGSAVALVQLTGHASPAAGWRPARGLALQATHTLAPGEVMTWQNCPLANPRVDAAMRATDRPPLPDAVAPGGQITGWIAFSLPRQADQAAVAIAEQTTTGGSATSVPIDPQTPPAPARP